MSGWPVFIASVVSLAGIYAVLTMILNMEAGWTGLWDLGVHGFFAIGAYFYVLATVEDSNSLIFAPKWPIWVGVVGAGALTSVLAWLLSFPALRLRGESFLITTLAFGEITRDLITNQADVTGGSHGFSQIARPFDNAFAGRGYTIALTGFIIVCVAGVFVLTRRVGFSPAGRVLRALRDNEPAALAVGKNVNRYRRLTYIVAGGMVGAWAPVYIWHLRTIFPHMFGVDISIVVWTALVIGGIGSLRGPIVGAFALIVTVEIARVLLSSAKYAVVLASLRPIVIGVALIVMLRLRPQGLFSESAAFEKHSRHPKADGRSERRVGAA